MIDPRRLCSMPVGVRDFDWTDADVRRYAACVGGHGFVPTFPTVVAWISAPTFTELGVDPVHALHAAQRIEWAAPIDGPRRVRVESHVTGVRDKGASRGAIVMLEQRILDRDTEQHLATLTTTCFGRKEGGCGDAGREPAPPRPVPAREPDVTLLAATAADLARSYSHTGDANPLHTDLAVANAAGFRKPILHGLCGFGIAGRIACEALADLYPRRLVAVEARFTAPVYPGDTLAIDLWRDEAGVAFRVRVPERGSVVMSAGYARAA